MRLKWQPPHELSVLAPLEPSSTAIPSLPLCAARLSDAFALCYHTAAHSAANVSVSCGGYAPIATPARCRPTTAAPAWPHISKASTGTLCSSSHFQRYWDFPLSLLALDVGTLH
jgi:hypothetical protein